ncbi:hypothetical protein [Histophilus somni]|uniref:hypothetical protein n=1 Tax=Histophilus somni TaxID=731 RepID=UPI001FF86E59|nr:hypothetical protein [Histophilus somni]
MRFQTFQRVIKEQQGEKDTAELVKLRKNGNPTSFLPESAVFFSDKNHFVDW